MNLFKKKGGKKEFRELSELPKLPKLPGLSDELEKTLPQLPEYPINRLGDKFSQNTIRNEQKMENFLIPRRDETNSPNSRIKEAISGKKEEMLGADEFVREQMMPEHLEIKPSDFARLNPESKFEKYERGREQNDFAEGKFKLSITERGREQNKLEFPYKTENQKNFESRSWTEPKIKKSGQVFIKIDKFEESLKIFELTKNKIIEMEKMLDDIKSLKEKEERELSYWMAEIQTIKNQTEKVERDIFSKLE